MPIGMPGATGGATGGNGSINVDLWIFYDLPVGSANSRLDIYVKSLDNSKWVNAPAIFSAFAKASLLGAGRAKNLPPFNAFGVLPPNDYQLTLDELLKSRLVKVTGDRKRYPNWDTRWRRHLVNNLAILVHQLWQVGINEIFVDGSFVEDKDHPNDIDGYFECGLQHFASGKLERELNLIDPWKIWTWDPASRRLAGKFGKKQLPMWHQYRVELFPHVGQLTGIRDTHRNELDFPAAFRLSRSGVPKGIIKIEHEP